MRPLTLQRLPAAARLAPLALAAALVVSGCGNDISASPSGARPPAMVTVIEASPQALSVSYEYPARLHGAREVASNPLTSDQRQALETDE